MNVVYMIMNEFFLLLLYFPTAQPGFFYFMPLLLNLLTAFTLEKGILFIPRTV
jgi:hypothetical protein